MKTCWWLIACALIGCADAPAIKDDGGIVLDDSSIVIHDDAVPQEFVLAMTTPGTLFESIRALVPDDGTVTINLPKSHDIISDAGKITLPPKTTINVTADAKSITMRFPDPKPIVTSDLFLGLKAKPYLPTIQIRPDGTVALEVQGDLYHKWVVKEWHSKSAGADVKQLPEIWAWSMPGCPPCEAAKKAIAAEAVLPFKVIWKSGDPPERLGLNSRPCFWWSIDTDQPVDSKKPTKTIEGWHGLKHLRDQWERSRSPPKAQAVWSVGDDWNPSRAKLIDHLLHGGNHRGRFERHKLETLSRDELMRLHAADHEGLL